MFDWTGRRTSSPAPRASSGRGSSSACSPSVRTSSCSSATGIRRPSSCAAATSCARTSSTAGSRTTTRSSARSTSTRSTRCSTSARSRSCATALRNPLPTFEANIRGTYNLLEACRVHRSLVTRVVVASSDKAYGDGPSLPYTEDMPANGRHPYDVSKSCTDLIALSYAHTYDLPVTVARCGNIYGGGDLNWSRIVPGTIRSLWRGERPIIRSNGLFTRDYIFVEDVVDAYLALAEQCDRRRRARRGVQLQPGIARVGDRNHAGAFSGDAPRGSGAGDPRSGPRGDPRSVSRSDARRSAVSAGPRATRSTPGLAETIAWYRQFLRGGQRARAASARVMRFIETSVAGAWLVEPEPRGDERGFFARLWCRDEFAARGLRARLRPVQQLVQRASRGTLRGLALPDRRRTRKSSSSAACAARVFDVLVDLRPDSPTYRAVVRRRADRREPAPCSTCPRAARTGTSRSRTAAK